VVLLGWRLWETGQEAVGWLADGPTDLQLAALAGGMGVPILVGAAWLTVRALARPADVSLDPPTRDDVEGTAARLALPVVLATPAQS